MKKLKIMLILLLILLHLHCQEPEMRLDNVGDQQNQKTEDQRITPELSLVDQGMESYLSSEELNDPVICKGCHLDHFNQWSASMHAYASDDPIFRALNAKGQHDTNGALGDFCIQCHAPMAKILGLSRDGLNLDELPKKYQNITCSFCHQIDSVDGDFNNPLFWSGDGILKASISDPFPNPVHRSQYRAILDRNQLNSSQMCGACHDVFSPNQIHLERTYLEWKQSSFNQATLAQQNTCGQCHMPGRDGVATQMDGVPQRRLHDHLMPGVDVAITDDFPFKEEMLERVQQELDHLFLTEICVRQGDGGAELEFHIENIAAGHRFPSGAAIDRKLWISLQAFDIDQALVFSSGELTAEQAVSKEEITDRYLKSFGDHGFDAQGQRTHYFWEIQRIESNTLPSPTSFTPTSPQYENPHVISSYRISSEQAISKITGQLYLRGIDIDLIDDLIAQGYLDPKYRLRLPTFKVGVSSIWQIETAVFKEEFNAYCNGL